MRTKEIIIDTVKRLVEQRDIQEISVQKICDEAGVSKGTFYAYFKDKYEVIHVFYTDFLREKHILDENHTFFFDDNMIDENRKAIIAFIKENKLVMRTLLKSNYQNSLLDFWDRELILGPYHSMLRRFNLTESKKINYLIYGIIRGQIELLKRWVFEGCVLPEDDLFQLFIDMEKILELY